VTVARYLCLAVPLLLLGLAARLDRRSCARAGGAAGDDGVHPVAAGRAGALFAFVAAAVGLAALHEVAAAAGWWTFPAVSGSYRGLPVDLWLGWAVLWGPVPVLLRRHAPVPVSLAALAWLDTVAMPALHPLVDLGPGWLAGEAVGLAAVALPAQLAGRWSADRTHLRARVLLQAATVAALGLWLVPTAAFTLGDGSWSRLWALPRPLLGVAAQVALLIAVPAIAAVTEFAAVGGGTPYPWDPPRRLVTTGPYAYLANPMQAGMSALLLLLALLTRSAALGGAVLLAVAFSAAVAAPHERDQMAARHGEAWREYRRHVRAWWPRRRPYRAGGAATLWLDGGCDPCAGVAGFLARRDPVGLRVEPAHRHPAPLRRAAYRDGGHTRRGVAARARGLEHVNLGWAAVGWLLRTPGVGWLAQVVTDAQVAPPHLPAAPHTEDTGQLGQARGREGPGARWRTPSSDCSTGHWRRSASTASPESPRVPSPPRPA
jgi:protein-S-isoprenylcysteine O-methyltransferase Ste14